MDIDLAEYQNEEKKKKKESMKLTAPHLEKAITATFGSTVEYLYYGGFRLRKRKICGCTPDSHGNTLPFTFTKPLSSMEVPLISNACFLSRIPNLNVSFWI
jgi:hypothetical protein